jgi:hypothetical protein
MERQTRNGTGAPAQAGFSMIELLVVAGLIIVMAAVSVPAIAGYLKNYTIRGATQQVAGEIQIARNKAIVKNVNAGVVFGILDSNTYRIVVEDEIPGGVLAASHGALRDLPQGVVFVPAAGNALRFDRMGRGCAPAAGCGPAVTVAMLCPLGEARCSDVAAGNYIANTANGATIRVRETTTGVVRTIEIAPGGRVRTQQ